MFAEEGEGLRPGIRRGGGIERLSIVAVESVSRLCVSNQLRVDLGVPERSIEGDDVVDGDRVVRITEEPDPRRGQAPDQVEQRRESIPSRTDPGTVVAHRGAERQSMARDERNGSAHAIADDAGAFWGMALSFEMRENGI